MSRDLIELLVSNVDAFSKLAEILLSFLTKIEQAQGLYFGDRVHAIIDKHALMFLSVLNAVLPDEAANWPYDIVDLLERIGAANSSLLSDSRLLELRHRWSAR